MALVETIRYVADTHGAIVGFVGFVAGGWFCIALAVWGTSWLMDWEDRRARR